MTLLLPSAEKVSSSRIKRPLERGWLSFEGVSPRELTVIVKEEADNTFGTLWTETFGFFYALAASCIRSCRL